jgi:hypothetical protein
MLGYGMTRGVVKSSSRTALVVAMAAVALLCARPVHAQETTESVLKGAFVYNFATFTKWPPDVLANEMPITICVVGDEAVAEALTANTKGRQIDGHQLTVAVRTARDLGGCHVLYVSSTSAQIVDQAVAASSGAPVLTISDAARFVQDGGIAELFVQAGKMRFKVNRASLRRSRLELSSRLLSLAVILDD